MSETYVDFVHRRKETAKILGISERTVMQLDAEGRLKRVQITDQIVGYRDSTLKRYLNDHTR